MIKNDYDLVHAVVKHSGKEHSEVLRQAYIAWYDEEPDSTLIGRSLFLLLEKGEIKHWVRDFCRKEVSKYEEILESLRRHKKEKWRLRRENIFLSIKKIFLFKRNH